MNNEYVNSGTSMVTGAFDKVASAAEEVGKNTKAKLGMAEKEASTNISEAPKPSEGKEQNASVPSLNKRDRLNSQVVMNAAMSSCAIWEIISDRHDFYYQDSGFILDAGAWWGVYGGCWVHPRQDMKFFDNFVEHYLDVFWNL